MKPVTAYLPARVRQEALQSAEEQIRSNPRFSGNFTELFYIFYNSRVAALNVVALRSGSVFWITHTMNYHTDFTSNIMDSAAFSMPQNIYDQAANLLVARGDGLYRCDDILVRK